MPAASTTRAPVTRALTVIEPQAWAIVAAHKSIENRSWSTPFRGRFAIHASTSRRQLDYFIAFEQKIKKINPAIYAQIDDPRITNDNPAFHAGHILGVAELVGIVEWPADSPLTFAEACAGAGFATWYKSELAAGRKPSAWAERGCCWLLSNVIQFAVPIPCKGALNLWSLPPDCLVKVATAIARGPHGSPVEYRHNLAKLNPANPAANPPAAKPGRKKTIA